MHARKYYHFQSLVKQHFLGCSRVQNRCNRKVHEIRGICNRLAPKLSTHSCMLDHRTVFARNVLFVRSASLLNCGEYGEEVVHTAPSRANFFLTATNSGALSLCTLFPYCTALRSSHAKNPYSVAYFRSGPQELQMQVTLRRSHHDQNISVPTICTMLHSSVYIGMYCYSLLPPQ